MRERLLVNSLAPAGTFRAVEPWAAGCNKDTHTFRTADTMLPPSRRRALLNNSACSTVTCIAERPYQTIQSLPVAHNLCAMQMHFTRCNSWPYLEG